MVIGKIKGIVSKENSEQSSKSTPDELEPLGEDTKKDEKSDNNDVPDELPELGNEPEQEEAPKVEQQEQAQPAPAPQPEEKKDTSQLPDAETNDFQEIPAPPAENKKPQQSSAQSPSNELPDLEPGAKETDSAKKVEASMDKNSEGFFNKMHEMMQDPVLKDKLMQQDLLSSMKKNWGVKSESQRSGLTSAEQKRLEHEIAVCLTNLKTLEGKWRAQKMVIEEDMKTLKTYEGTIRDQENKFKLAVKQFKIYQPVKKEDFIFFDNGLMARNISELLNALKILDDVGLKSRLRSEPNLFVLFSRDIDKRLSLSLKGLSARKSIIAVLEEFVADCYKQ